MIEYKTILYSLGKADFEEQLNTMFNDGWAIFNIWENPQIKSLPSISTEIIITFVRGELRTIKK